MGFGMGVNVARISFLNVSPGETMQSTSKIKIENNNNYPQWYGLDKREYVSSNSFYDALPDPDWLTFSADSVYVEANSRGEGISVSITIPNELRYYNRHYACDIIVRPLTGGGSNGGFLSGAIAIQVRVETEALKEYPFNTGGGLSTGGGLFTLPLVYPTSEECGDEPDTFYINISSYYSSTFKIGVARVLGKPMEDGYAPLYSKALFFLVPVNEVVVEPNESVELYGIYDSDWGKGNYITVEEVEGDRKSFIRMVGCR